jgi:hypothetical protein
VRKKQKASESLRVSQQLRARKRKNGSQAQILLLLQRQHRGLSSQPVVSRCVRVCLSVSGLSASVCLSVCLSVGSTWRMAVEGPSSLTSFRHFCLRECVKRVEGDQRGEEQERINCGVEVTESSANKQHTLSIHTDLYTGIFQITIRERDQGCSDKRNKQTYTQTHIHTNTHTHIQRDQGCTDTRGSDE